MAVYLLLLLLLLILLLILLLLPLQYFATRESPWQPCRGRTPSIDGVDFSGLFRLSVYRGLLFRLRKDFSVGHESSFASRTPRSRIEEARLSSLFSASFLVSGFMPFQIDACQFRLRRLRSGCFRRQSAPSGRLVQRGDGLRPSLPSFISASLTL